MLSSLNWFAPAPDVARVGWLKGVTYAHRGLHNSSAAENSHSAFAAAIEAGLGIECDVRLSADGGAVVFHDRELHRLTSETGPVAVRTLAELSRIALPPGPGDVIPSLGSLLGQVAGRVPLLIEIKTERDGPADAICKAVLRDVAPYQGPVAVMSFDPRVGRWFHHNAPRVIRGLVVSEANGGAIQRCLSLWQARADFLAYDVRDFPSAFAAAQRARGIPILTWTVSSPELRQRAEKHADGFIAEALGVASVVRRP